MKWRTVRLGELCTIEKGKTGIQKAIPGEYPLVVTGQERKSHNEFQFDDEAVIVPLVSGSGHGHASIKRLHLQKGKFALGSILCAIIPKDKNILSSEYLYRFLCLNKDSELVARMKGMANVSLPIKEIAEIKIPLPSLDIQYDFVQKFNKLEEISNFLGSEFSIQRSHLKKLRMQLLKEAFQGDLIKRADSKEFGSKLLEKILIEKAELIKNKKIKKENFPISIDPESCPFRIPDHWVWCRLGQICTKITDGFHNTPPKVASGIPYIAATHVKPDNIDWNNCYYVEEKYHRELYLKSYPQKGEILVVNIGAGCGTPAIIDVDYEFSFKNTAILKFNQHLISNRFLFYFFILRRDDFYIELTKGGLQPFLSLKILNEIYFPLPPLSEQVQISKKCDELMQTCNLLEEKIQTSISTNEQLLQKILKEELTGS